jgi:carboxyl-terminal processing protease
MQEYTFNYANDHKEELKKMGLSAYLQRFVVSDEMLAQLVKVGQQNKVAPNWNDLNHHKKIFQVNVKAQVARRIWGNEGFYPIFNESNEVLQQAVRLFDRIPDLNRSRM